MGEDEDRAGTAFCWVLDNGRHYGFLAAYPDVESTGKTRQHLLYNLRLKLEKLEKLEKDRSGAG